MSTAIVPSALQPALAGECRNVVGRAGPMRCYLGGPRGGAPMLLVHSINAAASAYEVKPIYTWAVAQGRRVFAPDLPGFGASDRSARGYTIRLYTDAIQDMLDLIAAEAGAAPVDALAVSLGGEFLARAAVEAPARMRSLALVTPTGFARGSSRLRGAPAESREVRGLHASLNGALSGRLWGQALYGVLVSRRSIGYFLQRTYGSKDIDPGLWDYAYVTSHQPGARHAPFAFLSARLFARDIRDIYARLTLPVWVPHATRGDFSDFSEADWAIARATGPSCRCLQAPCRTSSSRRRSWRPTLIFLSAAATRRSRQTGAGERSNVNGTRENGRARMSPGFAHALERLGRRKHAQAGGAHICPMPIIDGSCGARSEPCTIGATHCSHAGVLAISVITPRRRQRGRRQSAWSGAAQRSHCRRTTSDR